MRKNRLIVNQQCVIYKFQCDLCDASYVGYTLRHLHKRAAEQTKQSSSIGKHLRGGPLEITERGGGGDNSPKKNSCKGKLQKKKIPASSSPFKKNSCK